MPSPSTRKLPGLWTALGWAWRRGNEGGGIGRGALAWRGLRATLAQRGALNRWMAVVCELEARGLARDFEGEYLRALRPHVHMGTSVSGRVVQLIDHADWMESAFRSWALERFAAEDALVLAELTPPRGYTAMRLQMQRAPVQAPEGEMLLTLTLQRSGRDAGTVEAAALGFSRFRIEGKGCLVIGGVRGQRDPANRRTPVEVAQALQGWVPSVLLVRVMQELARYWGLRLVGLDPAAHRLQHWTLRLDERRRKVAQKVFASYEALWEHFDARPGPGGWMVLPLDSDEKLAATSLSPEKRERQTRRADYWIRTRKLLHAQMKTLLQRPGNDATELTAQQMGPGTLAPEGNESYFNEEFLESSDDHVPSRVLQTAPGDLN